MTLLKKTLGKGILDGLDELDEITNQGVSDIKNISINAIVVNPKNFYNIKGIEDLAESIKEDGLLHNLVVRPVENNKYMIISGERRFRAISLLFQQSGDEKWSTIPCRVRSDIKDDIDDEIAMIKANRDVRQRTDLEIAKEVERLEILYNHKRMATGQILGGKTRELIAKDLNMSETQVYRYSKINDLIPEFKEMLDKGEINVAIAENFSVLNQEDQLIAFRKIIEKGSQITGQEAKQIKGEIKQKEKNIKETVRKSVSKNTNDIKGSLVELQEKLKKTLTTITKHNKSNDTGVVEDINKLLSSIKNFLNENN